MVGASKCPCGGYINVWESHKKNCIIVNPCGKNYSHFEVNRHPLEAPKITPHEYNVVRLQHEAITCSGTYMPTSDLESGRSIKLC